MFQRLLSLLGLGYYGSMAGSAGGGPGPGGGDEAASLRDAEFRFQAGTRLSDGDMVEGAPTAEALTEKDLVWPGKKTTLGFANEEEVTARFQLTITDLPPTWYQRRTLSGGQKQDDGSVLLPPGEEVTFDVSFLQPPAASRVGGTGSRGETSSRRVRNFRFVITRFDPRRLQDAGVIVGDEIARWVPLPDASDLALEAVPLKVVLRPWRLSPAFRVEIENRSFLPPDVELTVLRAPTHTQLAESRDIETVARHAQALAARTPGRWNCRLPPAPRRRSYYLGVVGSAQVADGAAASTLSLPRPLYVQYVPYLKAGRDWLCLFAGLFLLLWVTYGIPIRKAPLVQVQMEYAPPGIPEEAAPDDLRVALIPVNGKKEEEPIVGTLAEGKTDIWEFELPAQWYGRNPWGWNPWSRDPRRFRMEASVRNEDTREVWAANLDLGRIRPRVDGKIQSELYFTLPARERPFFDPWVARRLAVVPARADIRISLAVQSLGAARSEARSIAVTATLNGKTVLTEEYPLIAGAPYLVESVGLGVRPRASGLLTVSAVTLPYRVASRTVTRNVRRQKEPYDIALNFSADPPEVRLRIPPTGVPSLVTITDPGDTAASRSLRLSGAAQEIPWPVRREGQPLKIAVLSADGKNLGGGSVTLSTDPKRRLVDIPLISGALSPSPSPLPAASPGLPGGTGTQSNPTNPTGGNGGTGGGRGATAPVAQPLRATAATGDRLVIRGRYFGAAPGSIIVGERTVTPTRWTAGAIVFNVPAGVTPGAPRTVSVRLAGGQTISAGSVTVRKGAALGVLALATPNPTVTLPTPGGASPAALPAGVTPYDLLLIGRYDDALNAVSAPGAMEDSPEFRDAVKSYCLMRLGRSQETALALANSAFRRTHRSTDAQNRTTTALALSALAQMSAQKGEGDQARAYLESATGFDPLCAVAWYDLTDLMHKSVSDKAALAYVRKGVQTLERAPVLLGRVRSSALQYRLAQAAESIGDTASLRRLERRGEIVPELSGLIDTGASSAVQE